MRSSEFRGRPAAAWLRAALCMALCMAGSGAARGAENDAERLELVGIRPAFGLRTATNAWAPVTVRLRNPGAAPAAVVVDTQLPSGVDGTRYSRAVTIPPRAEWRTELFVRLDYPVEALRALFTEREDDGTLIHFSDGTRRRQVSWRAGAMNFPSSLWSSDGKLLSRGELSVLPSHPDSLLGVTTDSGGIEDRRETYLSGGVPFVFGESALDDARATGRQEAVGGRAYIRDAEPPLEELSAPFGLPTSAPLSGLPTRWAAFEGIDAVILGRLGPDESGTGLSPAQRWALHQYVRGGGRLVIVPAADPERYNDPVWDDLAPARVAGLSPLTAAAAALREFTGSEPELAVPEAWFAELVPVPEADEVLTAGGRVLAASRKVGAGEVWMIAVPSEALRGWSRLYRLWTAALKPAPSAMPGLPGGLMDNSTDWLANIVGVKAPGRFRVGVILVVYCLLGGGGLWWWRRRGAGEKGWLALLALALAGGAAVGLLGRFSRASSDWVVGELGFSTLYSGEGEGTASGFVGMYAPRESRGDLVWSNPDTLAAPLPDFHQLDQESPSSVTRNVTEGWNFSFPDLTVKPGELLAARAMTLSRFGGGVVAKVAWGPAGPTGTVENRTGRALEDAVFRLGRRTYWLDRLEADETREWSAVEAAPGLDALWLDNDVSLRRRNLLAEAMRHPGDVRVGARDYRHYVWPAAFYGWRAAAEARLSFAGAPPPDEHAGQLLAVIAEVTPPPPGRVVVPYGACGLRFMGSTISQSLFGDPARPPAPGREAPAPGVRPVSVSPSVARALAAIPEVYEETDLVTVETPDYSRRWEEAGWRRGDMLPSPARLAFILPKGLEKMAVDVIRLRADVASTNLTPRLRIRKPGQRLPNAGWEDVEIENIGRGEVVLELRGDELASWMGRAGQLPEWELSFVQTDALRGVQAGLRWEVRGFDLEVEGVVPE